MLKVAGTEACHFTTPLSHLDDSPPNLTVHSLTLTLRHIKISRLQLTQRLTDFITQDPAVPPPNSNLRMRPNNNNNTPS
jgi:hypothetical protein